MGDLQIRRAHKRVEPLEDGSTKYANRVRCRRTKTVKSADGTSREIQVEGKTARDHKSGAHANRFANRAKRDAWLKDNSKGRATPILDWPVGRPTPF